MASVPALSTFSYLTDAYMLVRRLLQASLVLTSISVDSTEKSVKSVH